jgi:hypothetical protein
MATLADKFVCILSIRPNGAKFNVKIQKRRFAPDFPETRFRRTETIPATRNRANAMV